MLLVDRHMHSLLEVLPQDFNQLEFGTLTGPLEYIASFLFQPFSSTFAAVFGIIVLFHDSVLAHLELSDRASYLTNYPHHHN